MPNANFIASELRVNRRRLAPQSSAVTGCVLCHLIEEKLIAMNRTEKYEKRKFGTGKKFHRANYSLSLPG